MLHDGVLCMHCLSTVSPSSTAEHQLVVSACAFRPAVVMSASEAAVAASGWENALTDEDHGYTFANFEQDFCFFDRPNHEQLVDLLSRAMLYDEATEAWTEAVELFNQKRSELIEMDLWAKFCFDLQLRREEGSGGMSEAAKRPRPARYSEPVVSRDAPTYGGTTPLPTTGQSSTQSSSATSGGTSMTSGRMSGPRPSSRTTPGNSQTQ